MADPNLQENVRILSEAQKSFYFFVENVFSKSFDNFCGGEYVKERCNYLSKYKKTMQIAFRSGFKSTSFYAKTMHDIMFRGAHEDLDIRYFSHNETLGAWHIQQIKTLIDRNPFFKELKNLKPLAENVAAYTWDGKHTIRIRPVGIISFSRGLKGDILLLDDILSDPANAIHPTVILKINEIFKSVILEAIKPGGEIHIIGSPLSRADLYYDPGIQKEFHFRARSAIIKDVNGNEISAWPEFYTLEQIKAKVLSMGERVFAAEMMMEPYFSTDAFFKKEFLRKTVVNPELRNIRVIEGVDTGNFVVAGLDIGKKKHPAALEVFEINNGKAVQIHRKMMKGWRYYSAKPFDPLKPSQLEYCKDAIKNFGIDKLYYDNTRGEFEGAADSGMLTPHFIPVVFTPKMKIQIATDFEKIVLNKQLEIFDIEEMLSSICSVTNDLVSIETAGGHADEFWAIAMAMIGFTQFGMFSDDERKIRTGGQSIFETGEKIPKGW